MIVGWATVWSAAKIAAAAGCAWGSWHTWCTMPASKVRLELRQCFERADLCLVKEKRNPSGKGSIKTKLYPSIENVKIYLDRTVLIFALPVGLDPAMVMKKEYVFRQVFGDHITLERGVKVFALTIYPAPLMPFDYNYEEVRELIADMRLPIIAGKSRAGWETFDMTEHPHLSVSGETGSGKSVWLRQCLTTLIHALTPEQLQIYLVDMKLSEFHIFNDVDHVQFNGHEVPRIRMVIRKLQAELKSRGALCMKYGVVNVLDLPDDIRPPMMLLCIDEVALLRDEDEIMDGIYEIAAIGRSNGIFLILSMQRPDSKLLDSALKQCLTVRISGRQADEINSRIAIDAPDAAHIGVNAKGCMIFKLEQLTKVQAPYLDIPTAKKLLEPFKTKTPQAKTGKENILGVLRDEGERQVDFGQLVDVPGDDTGPDHPLTLLPAQRSRQTGKRRTSEVKA